MRNTRREFLTVLGAAALAALASQVGVRAEVPAVRKPNIVFILTDDQGRQLYDVVADPSQQHDVAKDHADLISRLTGEALAWKQTLPK